MAMTTADFIACTLRVARVDWCNAHYFSLKPVSHRYVTATCYIGFNTVLPDCEVQDEARIR